MKKRTQIRGWWIVLLALAVCLTCLARRDNDKYDIHLGPGDFRCVCPTQESIDSADPPKYGSEGENGYAVLLRESALSLAKEHYVLNLYYSTSDEQSVVRVFSSDYVSPDNAGGKILMEAAVSPEDGGHFRREFELDQDVDSVYIMILTQDPGFTVQRLTLGSYGPVNTDTYFYCAAALLAALALMVFINTQGAEKAADAPGALSYREKRTILFLIACAVLVSSIPLLTIALVPGHDSQFHMARIEGMARAMKSGQFPVRVHAGTLNDYGYPNSLFYPELLFYLPAFLKMAGVSTALCYKVLIVFINILTMVCAYAAFGKMMKSRMIALTAAIVYLLSPYRLVCAYYRHAIGEFAAMAFLPVVIYGLYAVLLGDKDDWPWLVFGACGMLQTHMLSTELTALCAAVFVLAFIRNLFTKEKRILALCKAAVMTVLLNLWFLVPMLLMSATLHPLVFSRTQDVFGFAVYDLRRIFSVFSLSTTGPHPAGIVGLMAVAFYFAYRLLHAAAPENKNEVKFTDLLAGTAVFCAAATTAFFPWEQIVKIPLLGKMLDTIQFPYRLMTLTGVCTAVLAGYAVKQFLSKRTHRAAACSAVVCLAAISALVLYDFNFLATTPGYYKTPHEYRNDMDISVSTGQYEYLPEAANMDAITQYSPRIESENDTLEISGLHRQGTDMQFDYSMQLTGDAETDRIDLPVLYIPNYKVKVNGTPVPAALVEGGKVAFCPQQGSGSVQVSYSAPKMFRLCELASLVSLAAFLLRRRIAARLEKHTSRRA